MRIRAKLSVVVAVLALFVVAVPSAIADYGHRSTFSGPADLEAPRRAAVEQATGNLFVVDSGNDRVQVFKPEGNSGTLLAELGVGVLDNPYGIAIDESGGQTSIYVADAGSNRIVRFLSDEEETPTFTVDATYTSPAQGSEAGQVQSFESPLALAPNGDLWVADRGANLVKRFDSTGSHVAGSNFDGSTSPGGAFTGLLDIAVNSGGDVYVVDTEGDVSKPGATGRALRFSAAGAYLAQLEPVGTNPAMLAVNPGDDSVAVSGKQHAVWLDQSPTLHLFSAANEPVQELEITSALYGTVQGLAFRPGAKNLLYVVGDVGLYGETPYSQPGIHLFGEVTPPVATIGSIGSVTGTEATVAGTVDPEGVATQWVVEYKRPGDFVWSLTTPQSAGSGTDPVNVEAVLTGLTPGAFYLARVHGVSADGSGMSPEQGFSTEAQAPQLLGQSALVGLGAAVLKAEFDTGGSAVDYHFEYGTSPSYGNTTVRRSIPAGSGVATVSTEITDLTQGAVYHYRIVFDSPKGGGSGADQTFTALAVPGPDTCANAAFRTGAAAGLTDCRAYELVTPVGADADVRVSGGPASLDGNTVCFASEDPLVGSDPNGIKFGDDGFCSQRGPDGWQTRWVTGPAPPKRVNHLGSMVYFLSPGGERAVFASDAALFGNESVDSPGSSSGGPVSAYLWEGGTTRWLAPAPPATGEPPKHPTEGTNELFPPDGGGNERRPVAVSEDLTHGLFQSDLQLVPEDENLIMDVYEWHPGGLRVISTGADGKAAGGYPVLDESQMVTYPNAISADGSRAFFHHRGVPLDGDAPGTPEAVMSVYMNEGGEVTLVSPREGVGPDENVRFVGASRDGDIVYLSSAQQLTAEAKEAGTAIYRYDVSSDELELVADAPGGVQMLLSSNDASSFLYRELGTSALLLHRDGTAIPLGTLDAGDQAQRQRVASPRFDQRALRMTDDGGVVVFAAAGAIGDEPAGPVRIYRWSADDGVEPISSPAGELPSADASIGSYASETFGTVREEFLNGHRGRNSNGRVMSEDGSRIFFETPEALVDRDINGLTDVYEWHDGSISLISTGTGGKSLYHESSADGKTVFFISFDRLLPAFDRNARRDLYVARPGGGFAPPAAPPACQGEGCRSALPAPAPGSPVAGGGAGNVPAAPRIVALGRKQLKQLASKGRTTVKVLAAAPGEVTARLRGKVDGRRTTVARAAANARQAGTVALKLKLSQRARKELAEDEKLRLTLEVRQPETETTRKEVMLRG